jgi:hypothetical protein
MHCPLPIIETDSQYNLVFLSLSQFSRGSSSVKAIFLITDGYSNGGDPRPTAELLKSTGVELFTFGIREDAHCCPFSATL